jgi:hypothetical protein
VLRDVQERSREGVADVAVQRQRIETQLANVRTMFELGDLSREEYVQRREQLRSRKESLRESDEWEGILAQAAAFLTDLPAAWRAANDAQRNALARMLYVQVLIKDDRVAAVEPQPSFAPFFSWDCQVRRLSGGSDGDRSVGCILPVGSLVIAVRPPLHVAGRSKRATYRSPRQRKLSAEQVEAIRTEAGNRTLRELAAEFGVSHETIRTVLRQQLPALAEMR